MLMANILSGLETVSTLEEPGMSFKIETMEPNGDVTDFVRRSSQGPSIHRQTPILSRSPDPVHVKIEPVSLPPPQQSLGQAQTPISVAVSTSSGDLTLEELGPRLRERITKIRHIFPSMTVIMAHAVLEQCKGDLHAASERYSRIKTVSNDDAKSPPPPAPSLPPPPPPLPPPLLPQKIHDQHVSEPNVPLIARLHFCFPSRFGLPGLNHSQSLTSFLSRRLL
jgi:hypothetical protein